MNFGDVEVISTIASSCCTVDVNNDVLRNTSWNSFEEQPKYVGWWNLYCWFTYNNQQAVTSEEKTNKSNATLVTAKHECPKTRPPRASTEEQQEEDERSINNTMALILFKVQNAKKNDETVMTTKQHDVIQRKIDCFLRRTTTRRRTSSGGKSCTGDEIINDSISVTTTNVCIPTSTTRSRSVMMTPLDYKNESTRWLSKLNLPSAHPPHRCKLRGVSKDLFSSKSTRSRSVSTSSTPVSYNTECTLWLAKLNIPSIHPPRRYQLKGVSKDLFSSKCKTSKLVHVED